MVKIFPSKIYDIDRYKNHIKTLTFDKFLLLVFLERDSTIWIEIKIELNRRPKSAFD